MKKIIALALALIMALSMASVAFALDTIAPGEKFTWDTTTLGTVATANGTTWNYTENNAAKREWKVSYDFTSSVTDYKGASMVDSVVINKDNTVSITIKEALTSTTAKEINGLITLTNKEDSDVTIPLNFNYSVANEVKYVEGVKKAADAADDADISALMEKNNVLYAEDGAGYVYFADGVLEGTVKVEKNEKAQVYVVGKADTDEDTVDAIEAYLGEDYDAIVEWYTFEGTGFKNDVAFAYDAYAEDPHFFYAWDGEKFVDLEAKFNDDEEVEKYEFTADAKGVIIVTDVEIVAAEEETKNPDTGANDVVGVAAALAVVSLVAAGAVSLKK